jgi:uncharacterized membrane protein YeaQ/YmgE (transglycosylase-associated protein family)
MREGERSMSFVIWIVVGGLVGWLAGRYEDEKAVPTYLTIGIVGAITGGLLWSPWFWVSKEGLGSIPIFIFEFSTFHIFAAVFGSTAGFWAVHIVHLIRDRRSGYLQTD